MTDAEDNNNHRITNVDNEIVSEWVRTLSETPLLKLTDDGEMLFGVASRLDRTVNTGPIDRLTITPEKNYPSILSIEKLDGKRKLLISVDSNLIPQLIDSVRQKFKRIRDLFKRITFWLLVISSITFVMEEHTLINIPDFLTPIRLTVFWLALGAYVISDRIAIRGVAYGKPSSIWGCTDCANIRIREVLVDEVSDMSCPECGGTMIPLIHGGPGSVITRGTQFENMLKSELKKVKYRASDGGNNQDRLGIDEAKRDIDLFYEDEGIVALYCLALEITDELEWSEENQEVVGDPASISMYKTWGTRAEEGSNENKMVNSLKDAMLARAIILRAQEKGDTDVSEQYELLRKISEELLS